MKRALPVILFLTLSACSLFAQIKNYIPIIKPVQYEKTKETFENIARKFEQKNYNDAAEIFRSFAEGGHGSGFVYVDAQGENYIITNRHVVANSEFVNLEFTGKGSTKIVYESCPIIYTDDDIDLAIVKFPNNEKVFTQSFTITQTKQTDGQEIWSAGFPGLLGKPMWQFAKGNITNEEAYVDQLVAPDVSYLIQHSASIDPGNSGGPLVIKDESSPEGYSVIGVNTWTITNRQNTFFAIPSKHFEGVVQKANQILTLKENKDSLRSRLIHQCRLFAAEINSDKPKWEKVTENVSYAFVGYKGWDSFLKMLQDSDSESLKRLETRFFYYNPMDAMRYAIVYQIWSRVYTKKEKLSVVEYKGINIADEEQFSKAKPVRTTFIINGVEQEIEWTFEHGHWRISNYDLDKYNKQKEEKKYEGEEIIQAETYTYVRRERKPKNYYFGLNAFASPYSRHAENSLDNNFNLKGMGATVSYTMHRFSIFIRYNSLGLNNVMKNPPPTATEVSVDFMHISQGLIISIGDRKVTPYFLTGMGYMKFTERGKYNSISQTNYFERFGTQFGAGVKIRFTDRFGIFGEGSYYSDAILPKSFDVLGFYETSDSKNLSNFQVLAGICYEFRKKKIVEKK